MKKANYMTIEMILMQDLKTFNRKTRRHAKSKIRKICRSLQKFGVVLPLLVDEQNRILAGEAVYQAAKELGYDALPVVKHCDLTEAEKSTLRINLNKLAEGSDWDKEALRAEFETIMVEMPDLDLTITGFEAPEIDSILGFKVEATGELDEPVDPDMVETAVSEHGDVWTIGKHRLIVEDATLPDAYARLMQGEKARQVLCDPPYNVPINGHVVGLGKHKHREFVQGSGEMNEENFLIFLFCFLMAMKKHLIDVALYYVFMDAGHLMHLQMASHCSLLKQLNVCTWVKTNGGMGSFYRSQQEFVLVAKYASKPGVPHVNNVELGKHGRYRTSVWNYAGLNSFGKGRDEALSMHPTVKPTEMLIDAILDASHVGEIILDPFGGSGSTMVAAEHVGRRCYMMELDPLYVDTIILRMQRTFALEAIHEETGLTFEELKAQRSANLKEDHHG